jgi:hypothetical protein
MYIYIYLVEIVYQKAKTTVIRERKEYSIALTPPLLLLRSSHAPLSSNRFVLLFFTIFRGC